ncbi:TDP-N-acetylfucosamine:lipid II N-acetylfucosaminyltransferase [Marinobacter sp. NFXS9]|uniref:TDP-N-acetylfucosamine:lipid II N-acetylfucosaminyltransferase n=1 Tax=Marinobacter sp. NFXS9 TaxID=2818433 RepID=UPI0032DE927E
MRNKVVHICRMEKFIPPFIQLVESNFGLRDHHFVLFGDHARYPVASRKGIDKVEKSPLAKLGARFRLMVAMHRADKIILHGLFNRSVTRLLWLMPWLLKKCYWVMWGDDLYRYQSIAAKGKWTFKESVRCRVIRRMGHLVTHIPGDVELARQWYGATGQFHPCLMYPSNVFRDIEISPRQDQRINIQIGNSADPSNNHFEILDKLAPYKNEEISIYVPLSYGSSEHAKAVVDYGEKLFGDKFRPILDFLPYDKYLKFLSDIDIAVFNHRRQQAMGNTINLLGLGKKVYIRDDVTPWPVFQSLGIRIFDVNSLSLERLDSEDALYNRKAIKSAFSEETLVNQLKGIFEN